METFGNSAFGPQDYHSRCHGPVVMSFHPSPVSRVDCLLGIFFPSPQGGGGGRFLCHQSQAVVPVGERGDE